MKKSRQYFVSEDDEKYFFLISEKYQTITLCRETEDDEVFQLDYRNSCRMLDILEKSLSHLEEQD